MAQTVKNPPAMQETQEVKVLPWVGKIPWRTEWLPTPVLWPGEFHGLYRHGVAKSQTRLSNYYSHSDMCEVISHSPFDLHFSDD